MSSPSPWFHQGELRKTFKVGNTIEFSKPEPSKWRITAITEEQDNRTDESDGVPAYTTAKLSCEEVKSGSRKRAFIRVYVQMPYVDTEFEDAEARRRQAARYKSNELVALQKLSKCEPPVTPTLLGWHEGRQGQKWPVPQGFLLYYAWEVVDGVRLGNATGQAPAFWTFEKLERDHVRAAFQKVYSQCRSMAVWPVDASPYNLLWKPDQQELLWVDFREWSPSAKLKGRIDFWFPHLDLAKGPQDDSSWDAWDGDTSTWQW